MANCSSIRLQAVHRQDFRLNGTTDNQCLQARGQFVMADKPISRDLPCQSFPCPPLGDLNFVSTLGR